MKAFLMFEKTNFSLQQKLPWNEKALIQDLELNTLFNGMAQGDDFIAEVAMKAVLSGVYNDVNTIFYRQNILRDSLKNASIIKEIYNTQWRVFCLVCRIHAIFLIEADFTSFGFA